MIVLVAEIGFIIPASAIPGRVALLVTQFLTLINLFIHQMSESPSESDLNALGIYSIACLAFVVSALAEFAISILIQQRKNSRNESENEPESIDSKTNSTMFEVAQQPLKITPVVADWEPATSTHHVMIAEDPSLNRLMNEIRKRFSIISRGHGIDFIAALIYPFVFLVFNCVYWSHFWE